MDVINYYAYVSGSGDNEEEKKEIIEKEIFEEDMSDFVDDSIEIENNLSDNCSQTNLTRTLYSVEEDAHSQYNMDAF